MAYADDMAALERRRQMAQALMQNGFQAQAPQQTGRFLVGPTALSSLGRVGSLALGSMADKRIAKQEQSATDAERNRLAEALMGMAGGGQQQPNADTKAFPLPDEAGAGTTPTAPGAAPQAPATADPRRAAAVAALRGMPLSALQNITQQQATNAFKPPEKIDLGDAWGMQDANGNIVARIPKGVTPDANLGASTTRRGQDMTASTAVNGQKVQMRGQDIGAATSRRGQDIGAITAANGQGVTMRGQDLNYGMEDKKLGLKQQAANTSADGALAQQSTMIANTQSALNDALALSGRTTTGVLGSMTRNNPITHGAGSKALTLENQIKTIQANLSFDALNQMRQASKTGGALGSITERELDLLGSTVANLDPNMSAPDLKKNLTKIQGHLDNLAKLNTAMRQQRAAGMPAQPGAAPDQGADLPGGLDPGDMQYFGGQ